MPAQNSISEGNVRVKYKAEYEGQVLPFAHDDGFGSRLSENSEKSLHGEKFPHLLYP